MWYVQTNSGPRQVKERSAGPIFAYNKRYLKSYTYRKVALVTLIDESESSYYDGGDPGSNWDTDLENFRNQRDAFLDEHEDNELYYCLMNIDYAQYGNHLTPSDEGPPDPVDEYSLSGKGASGSEMWNNFKSTVGNDFITEIYITVDSSGSTSGVKDLPNFPDFIDRIKANYFNVPLSISEQSNERWMTYLWDEIPISPLKICVGYDGSDPVIRDIQLEQTDSLQIETYNWISADLNSVELRGGLEFMAGSTKVDLYFAYRENGDSTWNWVLVVSDETDEGDFNTSLSSLSPGTDYEFKAYGEDSGDPSVNDSGEVVGFTFRGFEINTEESKDVGTGSATLVGHILDFGRGAKADVSVRWRDADRDSGWDGSVVVSNDVEAASYHEYELTGLSSDTTYEFQFFAESVDGALDDYGNIDSFTTESTE